MQHCCYVVRAKVAPNKLHASYVATCCMVYGGLKDHSLSVGVARVGLFCKLLGCRELKRTSSASANWLSIFLSSIARAVGECVQSEQQPVYG